MTWPPTSASAGTWSRTSRSATCHSASPGPSERKRKHLRRIAVDEIAVARGHRSMTVVTDLDSGAVVFVGDGNGADALKPFWKRPRPSGAKIEAVAIDMSAAHCQAVPTHLKDAMITSGPMAGTNNR